LPEHAEVSLKIGLIVSLEVLDLCWFTDAGATVIQNVDAVDEEPMLTPGMNQRRDWLMERVRVALAELNAVERGTTLHALLVERLSSGPAGIQHDHSE